MIFTFDLTDILIILAVMFILRVIGDSISAAFHLHIIKKLKELQGSIRSDAFDDKKWE